MSTPVPQPPVVYLLLDHDVYVSVHQSWFAADTARQALLDEINAYWQCTEGHPPPRSADEALRIEVAEVDPGPDQAERNRLLDRTRLLRVADAQLSFLHPSTRCLRPAGYCWVHDPSPVEVNPLRDAAVHVRGEVIYRACRHHTPPAPAGPGDRQRTQNLHEVGLHPDVDAFAFEMAMDPDPVAPAHPCCEAWCCLPEPPTEADHAAAAAHIAERDRHNLTMGVDPLNDHEQRLVLQDTVLARLARQARQTGTDSADLPPQEH